MEMIKGLFIEDDPENIKSYRDRFKLHDIDLLDIETFPKNACDIWEIVIKTDVDFIIIDNHLHKKCVEYSGLDVLEEIRKQDPEIYIIYLTSKGIDKKDPKLSKFDQEIDKINFTDQFQSIVQRIKRAYSRDVAYKFEREISATQAIQQSYYNERLRLLKEKLG